MKRIWNHRWFVLASLAILFWMVTYAKVVYAGTDTQLDKILKGGLDGLVAYFSWLIEVLQEIW